MEQTFYKIISSPLGDLMLRASEDALLELSWKNVLQKKEIIKASFFSDKERQSICSRASDILIETEKQLIDYFKGKRTSFDLPLKPSGTIFQQLAWKQLQQIPYGTCISYGEQAKLIGNAKASRAVGAANGKNPIGIIIPCHRVIAANGSLTGFAGGLERKQLLLRLEQAQLL